MSLSCIVISGGNAVPDRIAVFLEQAPFFEVQAIVGSVSEAIAMHQRAKTLFFLVEIAQAAACLEGLKPLPDAERPRLVIFGPEESYFLEQGAVEPVLFQTGQFLGGLDEGQERFAMPYLRPQGPVQVPPHSRELFGTIALQSKPVWLLMEPGQWSLQAETQYHDLLYVRTDSGIKRLRRSDLLVIEAQKDYLKLTARDASYRVLRSLKSIESRLDPNLHCRVHRSFIVLLEAIHSIDQEALWIDGLEEAIPIGPNYRKELLARLEII